MSHDCWKSGFVFLFFYELQTTLKQDPNDYQVTVWQIDEFMVNCRSRQLREKTMASYEQALRLFERWCREQMKIDDVDKQNIIVNQMMCWS